MAADPNLIYEESNIPAGMSCADYRRGHAKPRPGRWSRLLETLHLRRPARGRNG